MAGPVVRERGVAGAGAPVGVREVPADFLQGRTDVAAKGTLQQLREAVTPAPGDSALERVQKKILMIDGIAAATAVVGFFLFPALILSAPVLFALLAFYTVSFIAFYAIEALKKCGL